MSEWLIMLIASGVILSIIFTGAGFYLNHVAPDDGTTSFIYFLLAAVIFIFLMVLVFGWIFGAYKY